MLGGTHGYYVHGGEQKRYLIPSPITYCVNSKLKSYVLANCCHHYGMTYCINTTATSALFLSCMHKHIQLQFFFHVQVHLADAHITQAPTVFYLAPRWWRQVFQKFMLCWFVNQHSIITERQILVSAIVRTSNFQVSKQWIPLLNQITSCFKSF
jgi:hypothetical protein